MRRGRADSTGRTSPIRFARSRGRRGFALPLASDALATRYDGVRAGILPSPTPVELGSVATLLELAFGLSAWKAFGGNRWALRCNPSSGNLHPTEGYLLCAAIPGLPGGLYHYVSRDHALEQRAVMAGPEGGLLIGVSSIHWREAWKYGMRAWRYCQHDCGHAIAAVSLRGRGARMADAMVSTAADEVLAGLLGLDRAADFARRRRTRRRMRCCGSATAMRSGRRSRARCAMREATWQGHANRLSARRTCDGR